MIELYYDSYSVAYFIVSQEIGTKTQMDFLEKLYEQGYEYLHPVYRGNKKNFISDVMYWTNYLIDKETLDIEYPIVAKHFWAIGRQFIRKDMMSDFPKIDMFFMILRIRILYLEERHYVRIKLKTLLNKCGYKKRSEAITSRIRDCMMFYHIQPYLRDDEECDIRDINLGDMITFRVL